MITDNRNDAETWHFLNRALTVEQRLLGEIRAQVPDGKYSRYARNLIRYALARCVELRRKINELGV